MADQPKIPDTGWPPNCEVDLRHKYVIRRIGMPTYLGSDREKLRQETWKEWYASTEYALTQRVAELEEGLVLSQSLLRRFAPVGGEFCDLCDGFGNAHESDCPIEKFEEWAEEYLADRAAPQQEKER